MSSLYPTLVILHGLAGAAALGSFWTAGFARKGGKVHRIAGTTFVWAMVFICATALPMAGIVWSQSQTFSAFLFYLVVITGTSVWLGRRAIRWRGTEADFRGPVYVVVALANVLASLVVLAVGLASGLLLLSGFSVVGLIIGGGMLRRCFRPRGGRNWWLEQHYDSMIGSGAATHVAFIALGLRRLVSAAGWQLPDEVVLFGWIAPVVVAFVAGAWLDRRYGPKSRARGDTGAKAPVT